MAKKRRDWKNPYSRSEPGGAGNPVGEVLFEDDLDEIVGGTNADGVGGGPSTDAFVGNRPGFP